MKTALFFSSDPPAIARFQGALSAHDFQVKVCRSLDELARAFASGPVSVVFLDTALGERALAAALATFPASRQPADRTRWVVVGLERGADGAEKYFSLGAFSNLSRQASAAEIAHTLNRIEACAHDPLLEIMQMVEGITGVQLKQSKRSLAETRLGKRIRALALCSLAEYLEFFYRHPKSEAEEIITLFTTHTTDFFRESAHFDYLYDHVLPALFASGKKQIRVWSAACSSGQEAYSIAITIAEYMRAHNIAAERAPSIEIFGTDVDPSSITTARDGIYPRAQIRDIEKTLAGRYFDVGDGELGALVRANDRIHSFCRFEKMNLLAPRYPLPAMDVVFLRNVLIYFKAEDVAEVARKVAEVLKPGGVLFLGHSESLQGLETPFEALGNAIYGLKTGSLAPPLQAPRKIEKASLHRGSVSIGTPELIAIGASTGGVEALKTLLEGVPRDCPPILIVQHIPATFSAALARRLNDSCAITICEAEDGQALERSCAYIAPGKKQMRVKEKDGRLCVEITDDIPVNRHKPSVDYLFLCLAPYAKKISITAALLTGMGNDGARGLKALREGGARTIAQDEKTSTVFGMPKAAIELGAAEQVLPLDQIAPALIKRGKISQKAS